MDRRFAGYLAIILVITTVSSLVAFQRSPREALRFLSHRTPASIVGGQQGTPSYSFDLMATRDVDGLVIRFEFLVRQTGIALVKPWNSTAGRKFEDMVQNVPRLYEIKNALHELGKSAGIEAYRVFEVESKEGKVVVMDFTEAMALLVGSEEIRDVYTVYAFDVDREGNVSVYGGCRDFFFRRGTVVQGIKIMLPSQTLCFGRVEGVGAAACRSVTDAPMGLVELERLRKGQRVGVRVALNSVYMFPHEGMIQLIETESSEGRGPVILERISGRSA